MNRRDLLKFDGLAAAGARTPVWGYNGVFPGPTNSTGRGRQVTVRQHNALPEHTAVHLRRQRRVAFGRNAGRRDPARRLGVVPPLMIQDRFFNPDGSFRLPDPGEFFGDVMLVNGRPRPFFEVERRPCRFRLLNRPLWTSCST